MSAGVCAAVGARPHTGPPASASRSSARFTMRSSARPPATALPPPPAHPQLPLCEKAAPLSGSHCQPRTAPCQDRLLSGPNSIESPSRRGLKGREWAARDGMVNDLQLNDLRAPPLLAERIGQGVSAHSLGDMPRQCSPRITFLRAQPVRAQHVGDSCRGGAIDAFQLVMNALVGIAIFIGLFVLFGLMRRGKKDAERCYSCPEPTDSPACRTCPLAPADDLPSGSEHTATAQSHRPGRLRADRSPTRPRHLEDRHHLRRIDS